MSKCPKCFAEYDDSEFMCPQCGEILVDFSEKPKNSKQKKNVFFLITAIVLLFSIAVTVGLAIHLNSESAKKLHWQNQYWAIKQENEMMLEKYRFYDSNARIIPDDGNNLYHKFGCAELDRSNGCWIYNEKAAQQKASPCPVCSSNAASQATIQTQPANPVQEAEIYGLWATINGEELYFGHASCSDSSTVFNNLYCLDSSGIRLFSINYKSNQIGNWDTFSKSAGTKNDLKTDRLYFYYTPDILEKSPWFGTEKMSEWTVTITEVTSSSISGTICGEFGSHIASKPNPFRIDGYFHLARSESQIEGTDAYLLHHNMWGGPVVPDNDNSGTISSGGGTTSNHGTTSNRCGVCNGSGNCHICGGTGYTYNDHLNVNNWAKCSICHGKRICNACGGKGHR